MSKLQRELATIAKRQAQLDASRQRAHRDLRAGQRGLGTLAPSRMLSNKARGQAKARAALRTLFVAAFLASALSAFDDWLPLWSAIPSLSLLQAFSFSGSFLRGRS